ncbi:hypothetical protein, partial [Rathayibacter sp. Leaf299]
DHSRCEAPLWGGGGVCPILENSTACTMFNANFITPAGFCDPVGIPLEIDVSNDVLFARGQT